MPLLPQIVRLLLTAFFLTLPVAAQAHPHVWVTYEVKPVSSVEGLTRFDFTWRFDAMFTDMVKEELKLKTISKKDWPLIQDKAFSNLKNYHYYMDITADGADFKPDHIDNFSAEFKGKSIVYHFSVTLPKPAKKTTLSVWDEEFYVDLDPPFEEDPNNKLGGFMSEQHFKVKDFIFPQAEKGAAPAVCNSRSQKKNSPLWGDFTTFVIDCAVK